MDSKAPRQKMGTEDEEKEKDGQAKGRNKFCCFYVVGSKVA